MPFIDNRWENLTLPADPSSPWSCGRAKDDELPEGTPYLVTPRPFLSLRIKLINLENALPLPPPTPHSLHWIVVSKPNHSQPSNLKCLDQASRKDASRSLGCSRYSHFWLFTCFFVFFCVFLFPFLLFFVAIGCSVLAKSSTVVSYLPAVLLLSIPWCVFGCFMVCRKKEIHSFMDLVNFVFYKFFIDVLFL